MEQVLFLLEICCFPTASSGVGRQRTAVGCLSLTAALEQPTAGSSSCSQTFRGKLEQLSLTFLLLYFRWEWAEAKCIHSFLITHLQPAGYSNRQNHSIRQGGRLTESDCHATVYIYSLLLVHLYTFIAVVILEVKSNWNMINTLMVTCCGQSTTWERVQVQPAALQTA